MLAMLAAMVSSVFAQGRVSGVRWQLIEMNGKRFANSRIYVEFDEVRMRLSGHAGCNRFFGGYELTGQVFELAGIGSTKMACMRPGAMEIEAEFLKAVSEATRLRRNGINLSVFQGTTRTIRFRAITKQTSGESGDLTAHKWMLRSIGGRPVDLAEDAPFLNFDASKQSAGGSSGCNVFGGNFEVKGATIKFSQMISTMRACEFEDRMTSERGFLDGLQRATHYEIAGRKLILSNGGEVLLEFDAVTK
jgi:heat shock protein HslJ